MGVVRKEGVRNTIIYYAGIVLGYFTMVVLLPKVLNKEQFGLVRVMPSYAAILAFFYLFGMPNTMVRFFPYLKNKRKGHSGILFFAFVVAGISIVITTGLFLLFKPEIFTFYKRNAPLLVQYYYLIFPFAVGITIFEIFNGYCRAQFKTYFATFTNEVYVRIVVLLIAVLYYKHLVSFQAFLYLFVAAYVSNPLLMLFYVWWNKMLFLKPNKAIIKKPLFGQMLNYGFYNFFGGATGMLMDKLDFLFIPGLLSLADAGIYSVAVLLALAVTLPAKALLNILYPLTADAFKTNDKAKLLYLYESSSRIQLFIGSFLFIMIWVNYDSFFNLIHPAFLLSKYAFLILSFGRLADMATGINGSMIMNSKHYRYDLLFTVFLVSITFANNWFLIPIYGLNGAAFATASAIFLFNLFRTLFVLKTLKMQPFNIGTLKIVLTVTIIFLIGTYLPSSGNYVFDILYKTMITGFLFLISLLYLKLIPEISDLVISVYRRGKRIAAKPFGKKPKG